VEAVFFMHFNGSAFCLSDAPRAKGEFEKENAMKRFGILVAAAAFCAALVASGPAPAFDGDGRHCCGWHYYGDYSYGCGCYYGDELGLAAVVTRRLGSAASFPIAPLVAATLSAPPTIGNYCVAGGVTCLLSEPSRIGNDCFCWAHSGYARGLVQLLIPAGE
jgi:hypothetical protein